MKLSQYRLLQNEERRQIIEYLHTIQYEVVDPSATIKTFNIETYYELRIKARTPDRSWPKDLSKKEKILCKIAMIKAMLSASITIEDSEASAITTALAFLRSVESEIYSHKSVAGGPKFEGIPKDAAEVISGFYVNLLKAFQKKFKI
jgi:hypothetical protein